MSNISKFYYAKNLVSLLVNETLKFFFCCILIRFLISSFIHALINSYFKSVDCMRSCVNVTHEFKHVIGILKLYDDDDDDDDDDKYKNERLQRLIIVIICKED